MFLAEIISWLGENWQTLMKTHNLLMYYMFYRSWGWGKQLIFVSGLFSKTQDTSNKLWTVLWFFLFFEGRQFQRLMCNGWAALAEVNSRSCVGHFCWFAAQRQAMCPNAFFLSIWSFIYKVGIWHFSFYISERGCVICRTLIFSSRNWLLTVLYVQLLMVWLDYF